MLKSLGLTGKLLECSGLLVKCTGHLNMYGVWGICTMVNLFSL